jgi:polysaccharide export outer membrane protein
MHMTKMFMKATGCWITLVGLFAATLLLAGCGGSGGDPFPPGAFTGSTNVGSFAIGDQVTIKFAGPTEPPPTHEERIKNDGTITLSLIGAIHAAGKTPGELQKEIQVKYEHYFKGMTVTVQDVERLYYVDGEVNSKGGKVYPGEIDIVKAIAAAGGFTDYAKKTKIRLIRNGHTQIIDYTKAIQQDPRHNVLVYPNDTINVPRRIW